MAEGNECEADEEESIAHGNFLVERLRSGTQEYTRRHEKKRDAIMRKKGVRPLFAILYYSLVRLFADCEDFNMEKRIGNAL